MTYSSAAFPYKFLQAVLLCLLLGSCSPKKHLLGTDDGQAWVPVSRAAQLAYKETLLEARANFQTWQARSKGYLTINQGDKQTNHEVNIQIRMKKDEVIWISATALMGLEAGRILITPDSIQVINRMDNLYLAEAFSSASTWLGPDIDFQGLQMLLAGQVPTDISFPDWRQSLDSIGTARFHGGTLGDGEMLYDPHYRLNRWKGERLEVLHAYAEQDSSARYPAKSTWAVVGETFELMTTLSYSQIEENRPLNFPFSIPNGYRRMH